MLQALGNYMEVSREYEYRCLRNEHLQFVFNHFRMELKDHNRAHINPGFVSRTLVDKDFQHTINSIHFLIRGRATLEFDGQQYMLTEGDIFLIGNHVKCTWEYTEPSEEFTMLFNVYLGSLDDLFTSLSKPLIIHGQHDAVQEVHRLFAAETTLSAFSLQPFCLRYLGMFLEAGGIDLDHHISTVKKYQPVFQYITDHLSANLTIQELAEATHYSTGFFTKSFPKDNGLTIKEYIHDKIMSDIEQLLIYSDLSIREISDKYAFCEQAYFTRWFKKYKGCTPSAYRDKLRRMTGNHSMILR